MAAPRNFGSNPPVYHRKTVEGFHHSVFIMYHGTPARNVEPILKGGFKPSDGGMLGMGVYVSKDVEKTTFYANRAKGAGCTFKLLVYPGKVKRCTLGEPGDWQSEGYDSAWAPQGACETASGGTIKREENCVASQSHIKILGVCRGFDNLTAEVRALTHDVSSNENKLDDREERVLRTFLVELGLEDIYSVHSVVVSAVVSVSSNVNVVSANTGRSSKGCCTIL